VNVYSGEAMAVVQNQKTKYYQLQEKVETAKKNVMSRFNLTSEGVKNMSFSVESDNSANTWVADLRQWFKNTVGV
jgi:hypothetical protein